MWFFRVFDLCMEVIRDGRAEVDVTQVPSVCAGKVTGNQAVRAPC